MPATSEWQPRTVERVDTKYRKIVTPIPVPDSIPILEKLKRFEPEAMGGQPPVVWDRAEGVSVFDRWGNQWLDWSSGVLITNAGHGRQEIVDAIVNQARKPLLTTYCFPNEIRAELVEKLISMSPGAFAKGVPVDHWIGDHRVCDQAGSNKRDQAGWPREISDCFLRSGLPRPHPRSPDGRWNSWTQGVDRQS